MTMQELPVRINVLRLADQRAYLTGSIEIKKMPRFLPMLANDQGTITASLAFDIDEQGQRYLKGRVQAQLNTRCQRCLQLMPWHIDDEFLLSPVMNLEEADRLEEPYEPLLLEEPEQLLAAIIEDELILRFPFVTMHEPEECEAKPYENTLSNDKTVRRNPFDVLKKLKENKSE